MKRHTQDTNQQSVCPQREKGPTQARAPPTPCSDLAKLIDNVARKDATAIVQLLHREDISRILSTRSREASGYRAVISPREVYGTGPSLVWDILQKHEGTIHQLKADAQRQAYLSGALKNQYLKLVRAWGALTYTKDWQLTPKFPSVNLDDMAHTLAYHTTPEQVVIAKDTIAHALRLVKDSPLPEVARDAFRAYIECGDLKTAALALEVSPAQMSVYVRQAQRYVRQHAPDILR